MNTPCNLSYFELQIDKDGRFADPSQLPALTRFLSGQQQIKDIFMMSHGWNNDMDEARALYQRFFTQVCQSLKSFAAPGVTPQQCVVVGFLWPSKKFADSSLVPGGAAALDPDSPLVAGLEQLSLLVGPDGAAQIKQAKDQLSSIEDDPEAQDKFAKALLSLVPDPKDKEEGTHELFALDGSELLEQFAAKVSAPSSASDEEEGGGAAIGTTDPDDVEGGAQGIGNFLSGVKNGAMQLMNLTSYYVMKDRAGIVGRGAAGQALQQLQASFPALRIHLLGHSFGCRLVTSALTTLKKPVASMTLLQAAFSHNSFSPDFDSTHKPGGFRDVITQGKIAGPVLISHTVKDLAVGLAYALASRLARQTAAAVGDRNDPYGGLGRNGALHTPEATDGVLQKPGSTYSFGPGKIANLEADSIILGHSDIAKPETAYAFLVAAGLAKPSA